MKNKNIIGISGKKGSGKDTFYSIFTKHISGYENKKFADNLKQICSTLTGLPLHYFYDRSYYPKYLDTWGMTIREFMQKLGTEGLRQNFDSDVWVKSLYSYINTNDKIIITDVRFLNEADYILESGGYLIRLESTFDGYDDGNDSHRSEVELDGYTKFDYVIKNDGTLSDYEINIVDVLTKIGLYE